MLDKCVICNSYSEYDEKEHIEFRIGYVEGAGQLCLICHASVKTLRWDAVQQLIDDTPNDMQLGSKVRAIKNKFKEKE